ncbi:uncharacterized protein V6R79_004394 [Siganus canaliculatus]
MADYWKSQPRKFCQYCKCWIADNKPSVEFHERGKNHKENVAAKIAEIKKKSLDKAKQEERMSKEFAAMEEAALKAYQEDLKRMEREAAGISSPVQTASSLSQSKPLVQPLVKPQVKPQAKSQAPKQQKGKARGGKKPMQRTQARAQVWVEGQTDDGNIYYYNTVTGESQWEKPESFQGGSSAFTQPAQTESSADYPWMEAVSPEGYTYYYNKETGESIWEKPADFPSNEASESNTEEDNQEESSNPEPESLPEGEEGSTGASASQEPEVSEEANKQPNVPKISFRKRKAEPEPAGNESEDRTSEDASKEEAEEMRKEEVVQSMAASDQQQPEEKKEEKETQIVTPVVTQAKRSKSANPYGVWEKIQQEEDPYAKVDLQLPEVEPSTGSTELPPEPKQKFKERIITSLGEEGGPASFRKSKTQNGKSRSLRQRDDDD